jgi:Domain of unknown function (DUF4359)
MEKVKVKLMKKPILTVAGVAIAVLGVGLVATNPSQTDYENYATEQFIIYIKDNLCTKLPQQLGNFAIAQCQTTVEQGKPQIKQFITQNTQRQNYFFFSIYKTDLAIPLLPAYHFETVGFLQNFSIYQAEKK